MVKEEAPGLKPLPQFLQLDNTFLVLPDEQGMRIIDQHAAHERILFEDLWQQCQRQAVERQKLLLPVVVELDPAYYALALSLKNDFQALGFDLAEFGGRSIAIQSYPSVLGSIDLKPVFEEVLADLAGEVSTGVGAAAARARAGVACLPRGSAGS